MITTLNQFKPDYAIHPGEYLEDILDSRNIKSRELAKRLGINETMLSNIINGKKNIGPDIAIKLERTLGISGDIWSNLNAMYRLHEAREKEHERLKKHFSWLKEFPISYLKKMKLIPDVLDKEILLKKILAFFGISSPDVWEAYYRKKHTLFKQSPSYKTSPKSVATWLRVGEKQAETIDSGIYNETKFKKNLHKIRNLTLKTPEVFEPKMKSLCAKAGVSLIFVPEPKEVHIFGATKWINTDKALIIQSLRRKTDDFFWFTFFHEAAHILLHGKTETFIDDKDAKATQKEHDANRYARNFLIDAKLYNGFVKEKSFSKRDIVKFSKEQNVAPGIVVGFLQHDELIRFSWLNDLKRKIEFKV